MKNILYALLMVFAITTPAVAQTYQDSGGTYVQGFVPVSPGAGPLFTNKNPGIIHDPELKSIGEKLDRIARDLESLGVGGK